MENEAIGQKEAWDNYLTGLLYTMAAVLTVWGVYIINSN